MRVFTLRLCGYQMLYAACCRNTEGPSCFSSYETYITGFTCCIAAQVCVSLYQRVIQFANNRSNLLTTGRPTDACRHAAAATTSSNGVLCVCCHAATHHPAALMQRVTLLEEENSSLKMSLKSAHTYIRIAVCSASFSSLIF